MQEYYNAFISSTSKDLEAHREAVMNSLPAKEVHAINMEGFNASEHNALQVCYDELQRADFFIGFYAYRYGFAPGPEMTYTDKKGKVRRGNGKTSITEWEYHWALENNLPLLLYVMKEDSPMLPGHVDEDRRAITAFKATVTGKHVCGFFTDPKDLALLVVRDLTAHLLEKMKPSPEIAQAQENSALVLAAAAQQAEANQPKARLRTVGALPKDFREKNLVFHNREKEQDELHKAIDQHKPLITVHGRGGVGKTALVAYVLEALQEKADSIDGMVYHSLKERPVTLSEIVADFGKLLPIEGAEDPSPAVQIDALLKSTRKGRYLLLLDNFESVQDVETHQIDAKHESLRLLLEKVLDRGGLTIVTTTRYPIPIENYALNAYQHKIELDKGLPLAEARDFIRGLGGNEYLPDDDAEIDAFINHVRGYPRALEAGMGWLNGRGKKYSLSELITHETDFDKVMKGVIRQVIQSLSVNLRQVMEAIAISSEPVSQPLLEYLLAPFRDFSRFPLREALDQLEDAHFIIRVKDRYTLHRLDRDYCLKALRTEPEIPDVEAYTFKHLHQRAIAYYQEQRKPQEEWKTLADLEPVLMEFEHRMDLGDYDTAADLITDIDFNYLLLWGHVELMRDYHLRLQGKIQDRTLQRVSLGNLGNAYHDLGEVEKAIQYHEDALEISREIGDRRGEGACLGNLGNAYSDLGEVEKAIQYHEDALKISREVGDRGGEGVDLGNLGLAYHDLGEVEKAIQYHEDALKISREIKDRHGEGYRLGNLGLAKALQGDLVTGQAHLQASIQILTEIQAVSYLQYQLESLAQVELLRQDLPAAQAAIEQALTHDVPSNNYAVHALAGVIALRQGQAEAAKQAFDTAVEQASVLLEKTPKFYEALYMRALARAGLLLLDQADVAAVLADYAAALEACSLPGVRRDALRRLGYLSPVDDTGRLESVYARLNQD